MVLNKKKMAAALAAVNLYLEEEAAVYDEQAAMQKRVQSNDFSAWGHSGRQDMMSMRRLIQMRVFTNFR
jgi:DNA-binding GntR family transcriptional regulator